MDILPAIDLRDGRVVRLEKGDYQRQTTYSDDPAAVAEQFVAAGVRWIHVVDLDAAKSGRLTNAASVKKIRAAVDKAAPAGSVCIEFGGGIRNARAIQNAADCGADRMVIGSAALKDWAWFESLLADESIANASIALGLDARDGLCAAQGWTEQTSISAVELAGRVSGSQLGAIVYTDIHRDGMLTGINVGATEQMVRATDVGVIASGGLSTIEDVRLARQIGCAGVIVGKAWYEGRIDLAAACEMTQSP
ncbi:MAG: 1-(5-phosphoribosyl)-5-[(5-phosphoribosylamino)methylideneamino]imidazole-4-carboxamide isomerase [Phycisphaerae bacterium]